MKYGFVFSYGEAREAAELAHEAEEAGWDGFFVWEPIWGIDAWVQLTAAAMVTSKIRLGTMLTPLPIRKPWKVASETATLDRLSGGRVILSVGLGAADTGFASFGEPTDRKTRAELLDESLEVMTGLWQGQPFRYSGRHYQVEPTEFYPPPPPLQKPRIPVWVVGAWPREKSLERALKYDGILPVVMGAGHEILTLTPEHVHEIAAYAAAHRENSGHFDIVVEGNTPGDDPGAAAEKVLPWVDAGATWWIEANWNMPKDPIANPMVETLRKRIRQGPPR
ncbi:coenzyme F420-dependent N5,N10-methylene tetrahydromethanopterin reductase [Longilinea arvoryzae]|uniref:Coenzyme F420-dependent N5,N10-methylene tetrahydromethanopterin reductase n=1 Tax=Longilinea arvoryzae TaxID=360412 RepID=A0A0S7BGJ1_9CHLR|nr:LLM class flavin-dependent oxidoreductase [Longilinea arvoryzae]GAP12939.1 coenzyme F420-dependent N5,N10-methylene tetrahydromethanopterin reductase [Longilinea arvoryzae]